MIGKIIRYMRVSGGYSQKELAKKLNIATTTLSGYETEYSNPNYKVVQDIAQACDFDITFTDKSNGKVISDKDV